MTNSASSKIDITQPDRVARTVRRKGKKSVPFQNDPEILKRLAKIAEMMAKGRYAYEMAAELKCSIATAKRDIGRVRELWRMDAREQLASVKEESINVYRRVLIEAWGKVISDATRADRYMGIILSAQEKIDRLTGAVEPENMNMNVKVDGTIEVKDMDDVRDARWKQVQSSLVSLAKEEKKA